MTRAFGSKDDALRAACDLIGRKCVVLPCKDPITKNRCCCDYDVVQRPQNAQAS